MTRKNIAVYDTTTGLIRQTVRCSERDADKQHLRFPGCASLDVTDTQPDCHPEKHSYDILNKKIVARTALSIGKKATAALKLESAAKTEEAACGNQQDLIAAALLGGDAEKAALAAFMTARRTRAAKLQNLLAQVNAGNSLSDVEKLSW